ncbi:hypothetical protein LIER_29073 [Lithospermum erythrorhizon]|uniref:Seipin n=1 Tax=Lithospermum erythrorhizon TaxID=34254 RepID=A0AAV3RHY2_LITER
MDQSKLSIQNDDVQHLNHASGDCTAPPPENASLGCTAQPPEMNLCRRRSVPHRESEKLENSMENQNIIDENSMNLDSIKGVNEEKSKLSMIKNKKGEEISNVEEIESNYNENEDLNTRGLFSSVNMLIKSITYKISFMISIVTYPVWLIYWSYIFFTDPFGIVRRVKSYVVGKVVRVCWEWLKEQGYVWKLGVKCGWGVLWAGYVSIVLVGLLFVAFMMGGVVVRGVVEEPLRIKETLNFDYTEKSPVAYVPLLVMGEYKENVDEVGSIGGGRVMPPNRKLQATVSLKLPESDYNRNLGNFQARVDLLSADGTTIASSREVCILQFKSDIIRVVLTFLNIAPLITGYTSESQNLDIKFRGFTDGIRPTASLRVIIEQRAEFQPGGGIPEIYAASLALESELPLLKRVMWYWKKTLYVWISLTLFIVELVFALLCCRPLLIPRMKLRENSASRNGPDVSPPVKGIYHIVPPPLSLLTSLDKI